MNTLLPQTSIALVLIAASQFGCAATPGGGPTYIAEGWRSFSTARTGDGPGTIYRVDPQGTVAQVTTIDVTPHTDEQQTFNFDKSSELSLGEVLKTMEVPSQGIPVNMQGKLEQKSTIRTTSTQVTHEYLNDRDLAENVLTTAMIGIRIRKDNTYYIIRETLKTSQLTFKIQRSWLSSMGVDVDFYGLVTNKTNAVTSSNNEISLDTTFATPHRVWYKAEKLDVQPSHGAAPDQPAIVNRDPNHATADLVLPANIAHDP